MQLLVVPSHRLRITTFLISDCRATVEGLPVFIVCLQHITLTELPCWMAIPRAVLAKVQSIFISGQLKVIPLFHYSVFRILLTPTRELGYTDLKPKKPKLIRDYIIYVIINIGLQPRPSCYAWVWLCQTTNNEGGEPAL